MRLRNSIAVVICGAAMTANGGWGASAPLLTQQIVIDDFAFAPATMEIHLGEAVEWMNRGIFHHSATEAGDRFDVDIAVGARARFTPKAAGSFDYICKYHPGMKGRLIVLPPSS